MRALAEFIMRGRLQAGIVALAGNLLPFISPAAVNLVVLRKGLGEGLIVVLWAVLPSVVAGYAGNFGPLLAALSVALLLLSMIAAEALKLTVSWARVLLVISATSGIASLTVNQLLPGEMVKLDAYIGDVFAELANQQGRQTFVPGREFVLGMIGYMLALNVVLSLLLARWWQSMLFNPGGLQAEFHQLRLNVLPAVLLAAAVLWCYLSAPDYSGWAGLLGLPLLLSAVGLVHHSVAVMGMGIHWLVLFYIGLILIGPLSVVLMGLGLLDSIINIRSRLSPARPDDKG